jgi:hypothetical protein
MKPLKPQRHSKKWYVITTHGELPMLATTLFFAAIVSDPQVAPEPVWVEAEAYLSQSGSVGPDRPPYASGGECLGSNWGAAATHQAQYRFLNQVPLPKTILYLRYARQPDPPSFLHIFLDDKLIARRITLTSTGGWGHISDDEWRYVLIEAGSVTAGWHDLKIASASDSNNTNIDGFFVGGPGFQPPGTRDGVESARRARLQSGPQTATAEWIDASHTLGQFDGSLPDWYYPSEESSERAKIRPPQLVRLTETGAQLTVGPAEDAVDTHVGDFFQGWQVMETLVEPQPMVVLERNFDRWGLISFLGRDGVVAEIRKSVGRLEKLERPFKKFPAAYFQRLLASKEDVLASKVLSKKRDPSYESVAGFLAPLQSYTFLGAPDSVQKIIVERDGAIGLLPNRWGSNKKLEKTFFDPASVLGLPDSFVEPRGMKLGRLGGYLPAVNYGYWSEANEDGWELCGFMEHHSPHSVWLRTRRHAGQTRYFRLEPWQQLSDGKEFYSALLRLQQHWQLFFDQGMQMQVTDSRIRDASRAGIVLALCGYKGLHPRYGMGGYWGANDQHDGFPPTTLSMGQCLLDWGLVTPCRERLSYYLDNFVRDDGTLKYYGPAVAEYGQLLSLSAAFVRRTNDATWFAKHRPNLERIAEHLLRLRQESQTPQARDSISYGLLLGGAEADTREEIAYYFSGSVWCWRGLLDLSRVYDELGRQQNNKAYVERGQELNREAAALQQDVLRSAKDSVIHDTQPPFLPPTAGLGKSFATMTQDHLASYTNYRYWLETMSAHCLQPEQERMMLDYRRKFGGELLAMTRFTGHLDDWPFWHQAFALISHDHISRYLLAYYAHLAHHQMPGTFTSYEQVPIRGYAYRREVADYCVPAQLTIPIMTRWMLVYEEPDNEVLWLLRAVPRHWFHDHISASRVPTRWGQVSIEVDPMKGTHVATVRLHLESAQRPTVMLRLRHPQHMQITTCDVTGGQPQRGDPMIAQGGAM